MKYSTDTSTCPGLPQPTNTRLTNILTDPSGTEYSSQNMFLACRKPKDSSGVKNVLSNVDTRKIPVGTRDMLLSFHYFCGKE